MTTMAFHGSLRVMQKSTNKVALSLDRSESQAMRLSQPNSGIVNLPTNEASGQTFSSVF